MTNVYSRVTTGDPFAFWRRYNEAAMLTNREAHVLSEEAMRMLGEVEAKYLPEANRLYQRRGGL